MGGATGPVLMGHAFDKAGAYAPATVMLFALPLFAAALLQLLLPAYPVVESSEVAGSEIEPAFVNAV